MVNGDDVKGQSSSRSGDAQVYASSFRHRRAEQARCNDE